jgi:hypothetical protein
MSQKDAAYLNTPWPRGPIFSGHIYRITDPAGFFLPILAGEHGQPQQGYEPWPGLEVRMWSVNDLIPIPLPGGAALSSDPSTIPVFAPLRLSRALRPVRVWARGAAGRLCILETSTGCDDNPNAATGHGFSRRD